MKAYIWSGLHWHLFPTRTTNKQTTGATVWTTDVTVTLQTVDFKFHDNARPSAFDKGSFHIQAGLIPQHWQWFSLRIHWAPKVCSCRKAADSLTCWHMNKINWHNVSETMEILQVRFISIDSVKIPRRSLTATMKLCLHECRIHLI